MHDIRFVILRTAGRACELWVVTAVSSNQTRTCCFLEQQPVSLLHRTGWSQEMESTYGHIWAKKNKQRVDLSKVSLLCPHCRIKHSNRALIFILNFFQWTTSWKLTKPHPSLATLICIQLDNLTRLFSSLEIKHQLTMTCYCNGCALSIYSRR